MEDNKRAAGKNTRTPGNKKEVAAYVYIEQNVIPGKNLVVNIDKLDDDQKDSLQKLIRDWASEQGVEVAAIEQGELGLGVKEVQAVGTPNATFDYGYAEEMEGLEKKHAKKINRKFFEAIRDEELGEYHTKDHKDNLKKSIYARIVLRGDAGKVWKAENKK